jgi:putative ATPase
MTLFDHAGQQRAEQEAPLAARMRPRNFDEFVGQEHLLGPGRVLRRAVEADQVPSLLLWGPPGSGKTTLAYLIATITRCQFEAMSAVTSGVADLRRVIEDARRRRGENGRRTILFIDEIHRYNRAQQDAILPHVENGIVTFIGATTENPSFEVNAPLLSRCRVFRLNELTDEQVSSIVRRSMEDTERGLGALQITLDGDASEHLVTRASGDARVALNSLELASHAASADGDGVRRISISAVEDAMQQRSLLYDKVGGQHYDTISAFIKCVRGSDPDAALYWMARMLEAGEDPLFIARRLVVLAAEDIGLADPGGMSLAVAVQQAVHLLGMPEGAIPLAEATVYLATAPKSRSVYQALAKAREDVRRTGSDPVPMHLRNSTNSVTRFSYLINDCDYTDDDSSSDSTLAQNLPERLKGQVYFQPSGQGCEGEITDHLRQRRETGGDGKRVTE